MWHRLAILTTLGLFSVIKRLLLELTWFCNFCNGNTLFISHKSKHWKDSKTSNKACATVQAAEHDAVSENINKKYCSCQSLGFIHRMSHKINICFCFDFLFLFVFCSGKEKWEGIWIHWLTSHWIFESKCPGPTSSGKKRKFI